jgi:hypothetical protein
MYCSRTCVVVGRNAGTIKMAKVISTFRDRNKDLRPWFPPLKHALFSSPGSLLASSELAAEVSDVGRPMTSLLSPKFGSPMNARVSKLVSRQKIVKESGMYGEMSIVTEAIYGPMSSVLR